MNLNAGWRLSVRESVDKIVRRFPREDQTRITEAIGQLISDPFFGDTKKLGGDGNIWRRRVGAYRIFYEVISAGKVIYVFRVKRRGSNTY